MPMHKMYDSVVRGTPDSFRLNPDRLGYHKYARALAKVTRSIESPNASFCVGILGEWGAGKSFLWKEIKGELKGVSKKRIKDLQNIEEKKLVSMIERSSTLAFVCWCWIARNFSGVFCFLSMLKEKEKVATMMILIFPIGFVIWVIAFTVSLLSFPIKYIWVKLIIWINWKNMEVGKEHLSITKRKRFGRNILVLHTKMIHIF